MIYYKLDFKEIPKSEITFIKMLKHNKLKLLQVFNITLKWTSKTEEENIIKKLTKYKNTEKVKIYTDTAVYKVPKEA